MRNYVFKVMGCTESNGKRKQCLGKLVEFSLFHSVLTGNLQLRFLHMPFYIIFICQCLVWVVITCVILRQPKVPQAIPWLRAVVTDLSPWRPSFNPRLAHVGFFVDVVALGQFVFSLSSLSAPVSTISPLLHTHILSIYNQ
jgi:hypothetical protein